MINITLLRSDINFIEFLNSIGVEEIPYNFEIDWP